MKHRKAGSALLRVVCGLLCACCLGLVGCGGGSAGSSHSGGISGSTDLDTTPDFALRLDPAGVGTLLKGGQTVPVTLDLISENGFPSPVTLSITGNPWPAAFVPPTLPSLPKGTTKVVLNLTVPAGIQPGLTNLVGNISATGGSLYRYLNSGVFALPESGTTTGQLELASPGLLLGVGGAVFLPSAPLDPPSPI